MQFSNNPEDLKGYLLLSRYSHKKKTNLDDLIFKDNYNFKLSPKKVDIKKNEISTEAYKIFEKLLNLCEVHD